MARCASCITAIIESQHLRTVVTGGQMQCIGKIDALRSVAYCQFDLLASFDDETGQANQVGQAIEHLGDGLIGRRTQDPLQLKDDRLGNKQVPPSMIVRAIRACRASSCR
jgi:hypothetical protein